MWCSSTGVVMNFAAIECSNEPVCDRGLFLNKRYLATFTAIAMAAALPSQALACEALRDGLRGRVTEVTDGDTVVLESGERVRLIGMQAPKLP
jgi:endonuclease YncB( thermonuclease family)